MSHGKAYGGRKLKTATLPDRQGETKKPPLLQMGTLTETVRQTLDRWRKRRIVAAQLQTKGRSGERWLGQSLPN